MHLISQKCILLVKMLSYIKCSFIVILSKKGEGEKMGILLLLFMIAETLLVIITFAKHKKTCEWLKNRVMTRVSETTAFIVLLLLPQIVWDFRFKMCFYILVIRVVTATVSYMVKRKRELGDKSKVGAVVNAIGGMMLLACSLIPAILFTGYEGLETSGDYEVGMTSAILVDESRVESFETDGSKREVPVYFYYPKAVNSNKNSFPLVVFSHGAFGYYESNTSTYMELASQGYVVISLDHPYHSFFTTDTTGKLITVNPDFMQEVLYINEDTTPEGEIFTISSKWLAIRSADMNFVLDMIKRTKEEVECVEEWFVDSKETKKEILEILAMTDVEKIGLMGHSLGGAESVAVGRQRTDIGAVIDLDGTMLGEQLKFENGCYQYYEEAYPIPLLSVDNEEHYLQGNALSSLYTNNVVLENAKDATHTYFAGSGHMNFTDLPLFSPILASLLGTGTVDETECVIMMNEVVLQYFDYYLKDKGELNIKECYQ